VASLFSLLHTAILVPRRRIHDVVLDNCTYVLEYMVSKQQQDNRDNRSLRCHTKSTPNDTDRNGENGRSERQFLRNVGPVKDLSRSSGSLSHQRRNNCHGRHGPNRVGRQKGQIPTPRGNRNGRRQRRRSVPGKAVQEAVQNDGAVLLRFDGFRFDCRRRQTLGGGCCIAAFTAVLPLARFPNAHEANQNQRKSDGDFRHVRGRAKGGPHAGVSLKGVFERKGAHAQQRCRHAVAHAPEGAHATGLEPALAAASGQECGQVVRA